MSTFSSREIAVAFWTLAFVAWALSLKPVRVSAWQVVKTTLFSKLFLVWVSLAGYTGLLLWVLEELGLWTPDLLKDTLIWLAFSAFTYPFQFHDPQKQPRVFSILVRDSFSVLIIAEALLDTYTFSLPVELILVPLVALIAMIGAFAEISDEHKPIAKLFGNIQALLGLVFVTLALRRAASDPYQSYFPAIVSSLIVIVLSVATWPYIYFLRLVFAYEGMLWRIGWRRNPPKLFRHYAALRILKHLQFRPTAVPPFIRRSAFGLHDIVDRQSFEQLLMKDRNRRSDEPE